MSRLLARVVDGQPLGKRYRAPAHAFAKRFTPADALLLAQVDLAHGTMSGPASVHLLQGAFSVYGYAPFESLSVPSARHLGQQA